MLRPRLPLSLVHPRLQHGLVGARCRRQPADIQLDRGASAGLHRASDRPWHPRQVQAARRGTQDSRFHRPPAHH
eukprot:10888559-Alexandrium_andersonii.AAC.1